MKMHCYRLLFIFSPIICLWPNTIFAQASYEGQVLDKTTEAAIPFVTVTLSKTQTSTRTNEQGYFSLYTASTAEENLVFTCVGYENYSMAVSAYKRGMFVAMRPSSTQLKEVVIGIRKKARTLGAFSREDLDLLTLKFGFLYPKSIQSAQMYAKLFEAPKPNAAVLSIDLGRWQPGPDAWETQPGKTSRFRIHVMTVNPSGGAPDSILATREISLNDRSRKVSVRLDTSNVILSSNKFFVVIEWMRIPYNEYILQAHYVRDGLVKRNEGFDRVIYQPLLALYTRSPIAPCWLMINGVWQLFDRSPFEVALSATINY